MASSSWLVLCVAVLYASALAHGQCHESQRSLLLLLKHDFNTTHWGNKIKSWGPTQDCCGWAGVTCTNGYVTGLDLSGEGIEAVLNDSSPLFELRYLTTLNLKNNLFGATTIPPSFAKLGNLVHLNLSAAGFVGQIPIEISTLTRLETLDITAPYFFGLKVDNPNLSTLVGNMPNLVKLRLSYVDLSTQSSDWCQVLSSSAPHLQLLDLSNTGLSGPIHPSLGKLKSLSTIDLSSNSFSEPFPSFLSNFRNLTYLNLADSVSGKFSGSVLQLPALRYLDLSGNYGLGPGDFPSTIRNSSLETLILRSAPFSKNIPDSIGQLRMLSKLDISECHLVGEIPKSLSQLTRLVSVDMSSNSLTGLIPTFSQARSLRELDLRYNQLQGSLLSTDWKQLSHLEVLQLSSNSLSGSIPTALFGIPTLQQALLSENHFTGFTKDSITPSSQLHVLYINENELRGEFPSFIFGLRGLRELDLSNNNFGATLHLNSLQRLKDLTSLYLSHSNLVVEMGPGTPSFPLLKSLRLASCGLKSIPIFLKNHSAIEDVDLSENQITGQVPSWIWDIGTLTSLDLSHNHLESVETTNAVIWFDYVDLSFNRLHGYLPAFAKTSMGLRVSNNQFNSTISSVVGHSNAGFAVLNISRSNLYGSIPESICNMSISFSLDLSDNFLTGDIPECLLNIRHLNLKGNNLSGILPDTLPSPCSLETVDISGNSLHGSIPKSLGNCGELEVLDLSYNKLENAIPYELGLVSTQRIKAINVSHNELTGPIPTSFGNLTLLESLDLADNKLSGSIPEQLASLTFLSYFNVSNNQLVGRIPKGSQFRKFTQASFEGNKGLCGYPLKKKC
uniref:Leucine-rich repeat-containing N-terminal plant-type domain-containing protein n=1 Tax=Kalanchoe fedtschenkoi TaxID=63787 RepID=A0A7N0T7T5_KALFE